MKYSLIVGTLIASSASYAPPMPPIIPPPPITPIIVQQQNSANSMRLAQYHATKRQATDHCKDQPEYCARQLLAEPVKGSTLEQLCSNPVPCIDAIATLGETQRVPSLPALQEKYAKQLAIQNGTNYLVIGTALASLLAMLGIGGWTVREYRKDKERERKLKELFEKC